MTARLELNSSKKVIWFGEDTTEINKLSDIPLEYDAIFDKIYAIAIGELGAGTTSISYIKVTSIYYQTLSKKYTNLMVDILTTCIFIYCKAYCYYILIKVITLQTKMKNVTALPSETF